MQSKTISHLNKKVNAPTLLSTISLHDNRKNAKAAKREEKKKKRSKERGMKED